MSHYAIIAIDLPSDSTLPSIRRPTEARAEPEAFVPSYLAPATPAEAHALSVWLTAHQAFFIALNVATFVARGARDAARAGNAAEAARLLDRLTALRLSHVSFTSAAATLSREIYESYVRVAMQSMRADFSGVSSADNWVFDEAVNEMLAEVRALIGRDAEGAAMLAGPLASYQAAVRLWWEHHARAMSKLIAEPRSLARLQYERMAGHGSRMTYAEFQRTLRTPEALRENDVFFGVRRAEMSLERFEYTFEQVMENVRTYEDPEGDLPAYAERGIAIMRDIISERLS